MQKNVFVIVLVLFVVGLAGGQEKAISQEEYSQNYFAALEKAREVPRRHISKEERFSDGRVVATREWLNEYALPFTSRLVYKERNDEGTKGFEEVSIDEATYCRSLNGVWKVSATACQRGRAVSTQQAFQPLGKISTKNMVEDVVTDGKKSKRYKEVIIYKNQSPNSTDKGAMRVAENTFWLDDKGLIIRQEITARIVGVKNPSLVWIDTYEYNPKGLEIVSPIK